jgi:hypothetical protein
VSGAGGRQGEVRKVGSSVRSRRSEKSKHEQSPRISVRYQPWPVLARERVCRETGRARQPEAGRGYVQAEVVR